MSHTILPVVPRGDTLVMTPSGDLAGYSRTHFNTEMGRIKDLLGTKQSVVWAKREESDKDKEVKPFRNLIVDCSRSAYFGSEMIGHLVNLRKDIPDDGVMALAELSSDMETGLEVMKLDTMWITFDSREDAVRAIARESIGEKLGRHKTTLAAAATIAAVLLVGYLLFFTTLNYKIFGSPAEQDYARIAKYYDQWHRLAGNGAGAEEMATSAAPIRERLREYNNQWRRKQPRTRGHRKLVEASQQLEDMASGPLVTSTHNAFLLDMAQARYLIERNTGAELVVLEDEPTLTEDEKIKARGLLTDTERAEIERNAEIASEAMEKNDQLLREARKRDAERKAAAAAANAGDDAPTVDADMNDAVATEADGASQPAAEPVRYPVLEPEPDPEPVDKTEPVDAAAAADDEPANAKASEPEPPIVREINAD